jgi:hypothetical protein
VHLVGWSLRWEILLNALLIKVNVSIEIKYVLFNVLTFTDVFGLTSHKNVNVIHLIVSCNVKKLRDIFVQMRLNLKHF